MDTDPTNYDLSELRERSTATDVSSDGRDDSHGFVWGDADGSDCEQPATHHVDPADVTESGEPSTTPDDDEPTREYLARTGVDPINYDIAELRGLTSSGGFTDTATQSNGEANDFVWSVPREQYRVSVEDPTPEQRGEVLDLLGVAPTIVDSKPYLRSLPNDSAKPFVTDWLEYLTTEAGTEGARDAIERYREIGWITEEVEHELRESLLWIEHRDGAGVEALDQADHLLSFAYVTRVASTGGRGLVFY